MNRQLSGRYFPWWQSLSDDECWKIWEAFNDPEYTDDSGSELSRDAAIAFIRQLYPCPMDVLEQLERSLTIDEELELARKLRKFRKERQSLN